jgi:hypothetical protein
MKKLSFALSLLIMGAFSFTACVSSEHIGIENKFLNDDALVEGTWIYQPAPDEKDDLNLMPTKIILTKVGKKGEYALEMAKKPKEGTEAKPNVKLSAFVGKIKNVAVFSFGGLNNKKKMEFFNGTYTLKGDELTLRIMLEKDAVKDGKVNNEVKSTTFANMKEAQDFVARNITSSAYLSKEVKFKKQ